MHLADALGLARGLHIAGCYALFGTIFLDRVSHAEPGTPLLLAALRRLAWISLFTALVTGIFWFVLQSADMAGAGNFGDVLQALPIVIESTRFGHLLLLRSLSMLAAACCFGAGYGWTALLFAGLAVGAQAWLGHGGAMTGNIGTVLLIASVFHLAGGAAWIGSLPALFVMIAKLPLQSAASLARRYSPFGIACVAALTLSAIVQFCVLIGSAAALFDTLYARVALLKILLLAGLVLLAALNRYRLAPLLDKAGAGGKTKLLGSIGLEIALGMTALLAAGFLLHLTPPTMDAQP